MFDYDDGHIWRHHIAEEYRDDERSEALPSTSVELEPTTLLYQQQSSQLKRQTVMPVAEQVETGATLERRSKLHLGSTELG